MTLARGSVVIVAAKGAYTGKPRPAVVVQSDLFNLAHGSVTVCPITSDCVDAPFFRIALPPGTRTGLTTTSQVMIDKVVTVPRVAVVRTLGRCDADQLVAIDDALRLWLGTVASLCDRRSGLVQHRVDEEAPGRSPHFRGLCATDS